MRCAGAATRGASIRSPGGRRRRPAACGGQLPPPALPALLAGRRRAAVGGDGVLRVPGLGGARVVVHDLALALVVVAGHALAALQRLQAGLGARAVVLAHGLVLRDGRLVVSLLLRRLVGLFLVDRLLL